jgi:uncharacterized protein
VKKRALIIFVKNIFPGKVKTRLARSVGDIAACAVYKHLVEITEKETSDLTGIDPKIYFSDTIVESKWPGHDRFVQSGEDLGERMWNAFANCFREGYQEVICIGSDLADISSDLINRAYDEFEVADFVLGPAEDGGYYLIGMKDLHKPLFQNKSWSSSELFEESRKELVNLNVKLAVLERMNDIDTVEDLKKSSIANNYKHLYELSGSDKSTV